MKQILFLSTQLNSIKYVYLALRILLDINHLLTKSIVHIDSFNSIEHYLFACSPMVPSIAILYQLFNYHTQLNGFRHSIPTRIILFRISHLFAHR